MPSVPNSCENCDGQLFVPVWGVRKQDDDDPLEDGNKSMRRDGFKCEECGALQLTREIPTKHANDDSKDLPESAHSDLIW